MKKQKVLITGGNKGIGLSVTKMFIESGNYEVTVLGRDYSEFPYIENDSLKMIEFDLSRISEIPALVDEVGDIDILVNNAGIMHGTSYDTYTESEKREMLAVNIEAPVALISSFGKTMSTRGKGRIVNNASIAGEIGHPDVWYGITKAGVINATKSYARILGPKGVVVNAVAAGPTETDMLSSIPQERKEAIKKTVYSGRFAKPEEVASTMFWLATNSPEYINGVCIDINNGTFPR